MRILALIALALSLCWTGMPARAQGQPNPNSKLDAAKATLDRIETSLARPDLPDASLQDLRADLEPVAADVAAVIADVAPRLDAARARVAPR